MPWPPSRSTISAPSGPPQSRFPAFNQYSEVPQGKIALATRDQQQSIAANVSEVQIDENGESLDGLLQSRRKEAKKKGRSSNKRPKSREETPKEGKR